MTQGPLLTTPMGRSKVRKTHHRYKDSETNKELKIQHESLVVSYSNRLQRKMHVSTRVVLDGCCYAGFLHVLQCGASGDRNI